MLQKVNSLPQKNVIDFFSATFILNACIHELESKTQKHKQQKLHRTIFRKQKSFATKKEEVNTLSSWASSFLHTTRFLFIYLWHTNKKMLTTHKVSNSVVVYIHFNANVSSLYWVQITAASSDMTKQTSQECLFPFHGYCINEEQNDKNFVSFLLCRFNQWPPILTAWTYKMLSN